jgi:hypothetical protein
VHEGVAQLNLSVPGEEADALRREADRAGVSLSKYVLTMIAPKRDSAGFPPGYFTAVCGFPTEDFPEPADPAAEPLDFEVD